MIIPARWCLPLWLLALPGIAQPLATTATAVQLSWTAPEAVALVAGTAARRLPTFAGAGHDPAYGGLPTWTLFLDRDVAGLTLTDARYAPLTAEEHALLWQEVLPDAPTVRTDHSVYRKQRASHLSVLPFRRNPTSGAAEKLLSFSYTLLPGTGAAAGRRPDQTTTFAENSVLDGGKWYRVGVTETGIYRLDASALGQMGFDPAVDPARLVVYGKGGRMLPLLLTEARPADVPQNAVWVKTRPDGRLDYLLFYGEGPHVWNHDSLNAGFVHQQNIYADTTYYLVGVSEQPSGLRLSEGSNGGGGRPVNQYDGRAFHEQEGVNVSKSGEEWYGEVVTSGSSLTLNFPTAGRDVAAPVSLLVRSAASAKSSGGGTTTFSVAVNGQSAGTVGMPVVRDLKYTDLSKGQGRLLATVAGEALSVRLAYNGGGFPAALGYLDFVVVNYLRQLRLYGNQTPFRVQDSRREAIQYRIADAPPGLTVWDVTDPTRPRNQPYDRMGNAAAFTSQPDGRVREYIMFAGNSFPRPFLVGPVANQNLHALPTPELLIVTVPRLRAEAERLADHRRTHDGMAVVVTTTQQIYNEFSSGMQDLTAVRDFMKMFYDRDASVLRYVLLFGDCSYDFKDRLPDNTNLVPIFQFNTNEGTIGKINSFASDDFISFLDAADPIDQWVNPNTYRINISGDVGVGRLPVKNGAEARRVVDKIIRYDTSPATLGNWRNRITLLADDGDGNTHESHADAMGTIIGQLEPAYNFEKIYIDAFTQLSSAWGEKSPEAARALSDAVESGSFVVNYSGHGNENALLDERLLERGQIEQFANHDRLAFFVTATCSFGRYDDPGQVTGGELVVLSPAAGIGIFTATRLVFTNSNRAINEDFYESLFRREDGAWPRIGDVVRHAKNLDQHQGGNRNYGLLCDPSLRLAYPREEVALTEVSTGNGALADTVSALQQVRLAGQVRRHGTTQTLEDFNGQVQVTVYDKQTRVQTRGTDGSTFAYDVQKSIIYNGVASVVGGRFQTEFVVPKDIDYRFGPGKVTFYAWQEDQLRDAAGATDALVVGGRAAEVLPDDRPPRIMLYLNDTTFVDGGTTGPHPTLLAFLSDENGINLSSGGIGHDITATLHGATDDGLFVLNDYYVTAPDDYRRGTVRYELKDLPLGHHRLTLTAWDTYNNSGQSSLAFVVVDDAQLALFNVLNYPNPLTDQTTFQFDHNLAGRDLEVAVRIYSVTGQLVKTLSLSAPASTGRLGGEALRWDGRDEAGAKIREGVYVYQVDVRSSDGAHARQYERLVVLK